MQDFHACIRRCLHAIRHESASRSGTARPHRQYQSFATASRFEPRPRGDVWRGQDNHHIAAAPAKPKTPLWEELKDEGKEDRSDAPKGVAVGVQGHIKRELVWLKDPLKLAERTRQLLLNGEEQKAFELVRLGSRTMECTISWNALIDYLLTQGRVNAAWQTFNDVIHTYPFHSGPS
jgi:pentatricopeptide repeat protein